MFVFLKSYPLLREFWAPFYNRNLEYNINKYKIHKRITKHMVHSGMLGMIHIIQSKIDKL
jgi:hypothetical protein